MGKVRLAVRVFVNGALHSTEQLSQSPKELERLLPRLADRHARLCARQPTMIEIEFLDESDPNERFFRIGTDPRGMVKPTQIILDPTQRSGVKFWKQ